MIFDSRRSERRSSPRLENSLPVKIFHEDGDVVTETMNISRCGAYCRVNKYIEPMTKMNICLLIPVKKNEKVTTKKVNCQGVVVRTEPEDQQDSYNIAIYFNDMTQKDSDCIDNYVRSFLESED